MPIFLSKREYLALAVLGGCLLLLIVFQFVVFPLTDEKERMTRALESKTGTLREVYGLSQELRQISEADEAYRERLAERGKDLNLFSFMEGLAGKAGVKEWISTMKPSEVKRKNSPVTLSQVEMKLEGASLDRVVPFLYMVETSQNAIEIPRLTITRTDASEATVDVVLLAEISEVAEEE